MFGSISKKLDEQFKMIFDPVKVARRWQYLMDQYRKVIDRNRQSGNDRSQWRYKEDMDSLIGSQHDMNVPVTDWECQGNNNPQAGGNEHSSGPA